jgi:hypothetical protein
MCVRHRPSLETGSVGNISRDIRVATDSTKSMDLESVSADGGQWSWRRLINVEMLSAIASMDILCNPSRILLLDVPFTLDVIADGHPLASLSDISLRASGARCADIHCFIFEKGQVIASGTPNNPSIRYVLNQSVEHNARLTLHYRQFDSHTNIKGLPQV